MHERNGNREITARGISEKLKIPYSKINHYTYLGFFSIVRKSGNQRIYDWHEVENRYQTISKLANQGYPLSLIRKKMMGLVSDELL